MISAQHTATRSPSERYPHRVLHLIERDIDIDGAVALFRAHGYAQLGRVLSGSGAEQLRARAESLMLGACGGLFGDPDPLDGMPQRAERVYRGGPVVTLDSRGTIAEALAVGSTTGEVARRFNLSSGRVSQLRQEFHRSWQEFQGDTAVLPPGSTQLRHNTHPRMPSLQR